MNAARELADQLAKALERARPLASEDADPGAAAAFDTAADFILPRLIAELNDETGGASR